MGLHIGEAHWSYGGFARFRERLAAAEGIDLPRMVGFCDKYGRHDDGSECLATTRWDTVKSDLVPLLNHSDCDGELTPQECARVWPRLQEILLTFAPDDYDRREGLVLVREMQDAADGGYDLEFA